MFLSLGPGSRGKILERAESFPFTIMAQAWDEEEVMRFLAKLEKQLREHGEELYLWRNNLASAPEAVWRSFCDTLKESKVEELYLGYNDLANAPEAVWRSFCDALEKSKVEKLDLGGNDLGEVPEAVWGLFCDALKESKVEKLDLGGNSLTPAQKEEAEEIVSQNRQRVLDARQRARCLLFCFLESQKTAPLNPTATIGTIPTNVLEAHKVVPFAAKLVVP